MLLPRDTVYDVAEKAGFPNTLGLVGRLDRETSGVIVMTNDSRLLVELTKPDVNTIPSDLTKFKEKKYRLILCGKQLSDVQYANNIANELSEPLSFSKQGVSYQTNEAEIALIRRWQEYKFSNGGRPDMGWCVELEITLREGKHHQIRRMARRSRLHVISLCRISIASILCIESVPNPGDCRWITASEVMELYTGLNIITRENK